MCSAVRLGRPSSARAARWCRPRSCSAVAGWSSCAETACWSSTSLSPSLAVLWPDSARSGMTPGEMDSRAFQLYFWTILLASRCHRANYPSSILYKICSDVIGIIVHNVEINSCKENWIQLFKKNGNGLVQEAYLEMGLEFIIITVNYQQ